MKLWTRPTGDKTALAHPIAANCQERSLFAIPDFILTTPKDPPLLDRQSNGQPIPIPLAFPNKTNESEVSDFPRLDIGFLCLEQTRP